MIRFERYPSHGFPSFLRRFCLLAAVFLALPCLALACLGLLLFAVAPVPAFAQGSHPTLFGQRDFEMDWKLEPGGKMLRFRYHGASRRLRIDALDGSEQTMHRDLGKGHIVVLIANGTKGAYAGSTKPIGPFLPEQIGEIRTIAGETCREFVAEGQKLCVTAEGIPIMVDYGSGRGIAQRLLREEQPAALFDLPKGLTAKPLPGSADNTVPKGLF
jgi:YD repeat-containing protein